MLKLNKQQFSDNKYNAIIVGGGLGGLTAGATLAKLGKKVLLLEQHYIPGGCATTFKRKDFILEVGLHEMDGLFEDDAKVRIFDFLEVTDSIQFKQVPELFNVKSNDSDFTFPHGNEAAQNTLIEKFPEETKGIKALFKLMTGILREVPKIPLEKWKTILILPIMPLLFPNVVKASRLSVGQWLDKNIQNDELKLILTTNLLYYGDDPYSMSLMYFAIAQASYIGGGGHFIKGGSQKLSDYLAKVIQNNGGQVLLGKKAENILIENGKANAVQFRDAFNDSTEMVTVYADVIIANAAIPLAAKMLPAPYKTILENKIENYEEACSLISIYMGFDIDLKKFGVKHYSSFFQGKGINSLKDIKPNYQGDWNNRNFVFVDYSQIDSALAPSGKSVGVICSADYLIDWDGLSPEEYKSKKEQVANIFFQRLEDHFPGILSHMVYYDVGTAKTVQKYTLNPKGTAYGYAQTPSQSGLGRMPSKSPIKNLYFASAWSFPGGGFTGAITGGFLAAISAEKKIKWEKLSNQLLIDSRIVKLRSKKVIAENTLEMTFEKPAGFSYQAGQYAVLRINNPKNNELDLPFRSLSIVSHPDEANLRFAMRMSESSFKQSCFNMENDEAATIFGPIGQFITNPQAKNIAFIISGIGITPIIPMLKDLEKNKFSGNVFLFYSNKTTLAAAYNDELKKINLPNYKYFPIFTSIDKRIDIDLLSSHLVDFSNYEYYLVGTSSFLSSMKQLLKKEGVESEKINEDDFG